MSDEEFDYYDSEGDGYEGGGTDVDMSEEEVEEDDDDSYLINDREYQILSREECMKRQQSDIDKVCGVLEVGKPFARMLLTHWKWDMEVLLAKFLENGRDYVYKEAGITEGKNKVIHEIFSCPSCYEDAKGEDTTALSCGHRFCNNCWQQYITMKIKDGETRVKCMGQKCTILFDEHLISSFVETTTLSKYMNFLVESYIVDSNRRKWCPSTPHCGNAAEINYGSAVEILCKCSTSFCFKCLESPPHSPCTCDMMKQWAIKCRDDSETSNWLMSRTKDCPKCGKTIEKDGGCNLVTCKCGQYFCWLCGASTGASHTWTEISGHTCGKYKEGEDNQDNARKMLQRYLHFFTRYKTHQESLKFEDKLRSDVKRKKEYLRACTHTSYGESELSWLEKGATQLFHARRILGNSYVFAYFLFGTDLKLAQDVDDKEDEAQEKERKQREMYGVVAKKAKLQTPPEKKKKAPVKPDNTLSLIKKNLFEDQQEMLEFTTEALSKFLETPADSTDANVLKNIANYAGLADKRCRGLFDIIQNEILDNTSIAPYKSKQEKEEKPSRTNSTTTTTTTAAPAKPRSGSQSKIKPKEEKKVEVINVDDDDDDKTKKKRRGAKGVKASKDKKDKGGDDDEEEDDEETIRKKLDPTSEEYDEEFAFQQALKNSSGIADNNNNNNSNQNNNKKEGKNAIDEEERLLQEALRKSLAGDDSADADADFQMALQLSLQDQ